MKINRNKTIAFLISFHLTGLEIGPHRAPPTSMNVMFTCASVSSISTAILLSHNDVFMNSDLLKFLVHVLLWN